MRTIKLLLACSIACFFSLIITAEELEDPLVVELTTESKLSPLYLLPIVQDPSSDFQDSYVQQLQNILSFDLGHNGTTSLAKRSSESDQLGQNAPVNQLGSISSWRNLPIYYVVKPQIQGKSIKALILDVQGQSLKNSDPIPLTGNLNDDRRQIHRLADLIHKALFNSEGIASTRILFSFKTQNSTDSSKAVSEIWEMDYDGGNPRQITREASTCITPVYLPPKPGYSVGGFLYVSYKTGQPKIFAGSLKDGKKSRVSTIKGNQLMPAINQQRDKIAFICDITGNPDLFLQNFSTEKGAVDKPQQIFSARLATQGSPTFSPEGDRIAFVSNKDGSPKIYVMQIPQAGTDIKNIKPIVISRINRENTGPAWSPDGKKIAYCAKGNGSRQIWVYDFDNKQETQVTTGSDNKENPSWAPNSLHLAYNSSNANSSELYILNLNELEPTKISHGKGEKRFPNWEPRFSPKN